MVNPCDKCKKKDRCTMRCFAKKDFSEFPEEAFGEIGVTCEYGINVGGQCELEEEPVFREPNDFCSHGYKMGKEEE